MNGRRPNRKMGHYEKIVMVRRRDELLNRFNVNPEGCTREQAIELDDLISEIGESTPKEPPPNPRRNEPSA